jgi:hypothetical protein
VIERICVLAITRANRKIYLILAETLNDAHRVLLEGLLRQPTDSTSSTLAWLRQTPGAPSAKHLLEHLQRLKTIEALDLPEGLQLQIHQNRWMKLAREGGQMTAQHLRDLETTRRYATLLAVLLEAKATLIDQALDLHDRMIGALFNRAKRRHVEEFQQSGDIWVQGSRQFKDFDEYLIPSERFSALREANRLSLAVATDCEAYLKDRLCRVEQQLEIVDRIAQSGELPDVIHEDWNRSPPLPQHGMLREQRKELQLSEAA